jgi:hypothetical protein
MIGTGPHPGVARQGNLVQAKNRIRIFSEGAAPCSDRNLVRWTPLLRYLALIVVVGVSTGCADDVVMTNPRTGMTQICQESLGGLNPWSQTMACVANYEAQGWRRANRW